jgi:hypothetical protein
VKQWPGPAAACSGKTGARRGPRGSPNPAAAAEVQAAPPTSISAARPARCCCRSSRLRPSGCSTPEGREGGSKGMWAGGCDRAGWGRQPGTPRRERERSARSRGGPPTRRPPPPPARLAHLDRAHGCEAERLDVVHGSQPRGVPAAPRHVLHRRRRPLGRGGAPWGETEAAGGEVGAGQEAARRGSARRRRLGAGRVRRSKMCLGNQVPHPYQPTRTSRWPGRPAPTSCLAGSATRLGRREGGSGGGAAVEEARSGAARWRRRRCCKPLLPLCREQPPAAVSRNATPHKAFPPQAINPPGRDPRFPTPPPSGGAPRFQTEVAPAAPGAATTKGLGLSHCSGAARSDARAPAPAAPGGAGGRKFLKKRRFQDSAAPGCRRNLGAGGAAPDWRARGEGRDAGRGGARGQGAVSAAQRGLELRIPRCQTPPPTLFTHPSARTRPPAPAHSTHPARGITPVQHHPVGRHDQQRARHARGPPAAGQHHGLHDVDFGGCKGGGGGVGEQRRRWRRRPGGAALRLPLLRRRQHAVAGRGAPAAAPWIPLPRSPLTRARRAAVDGRQQLAGRRDLHRRGLRTRAARRRRRRGDREQHRQRQTAGGRVGGAPPRSRPRAPAAGRRGPARPARAPPGRHRRGAS